MYSEFGDSDGRYLETLGPTRLDDSRLLDAAETLVTLQTSDLGASNNPLFGSSVTHQQHQTHDTYQRSGPPLSWLNCGPEDI